MKYCSSATWHSSKLVRLIWSWPECLSAMGVVSPPRLLPRQEVQSEWICICCALSHLFFSCLCHPHLLCLLFLQAAGGIVGFLMFSSLCLFLSSLSGRFDPNVGPARVHKPLWFQELPLLINPSQPCLSCPPVPYLTLNGQCFPLLILIQDFSTPSFCLCLFSPYPDHTGPFCVFVLAHEKSSYSFSQNKVTFSLSKPFLFCRCFMISKCFDDFNGKLTKLKLTLVTRFKRIFHFPSSLLLSEYKKQNKNGATLKPGIVGTCF